MRFIHSRYYAAAITRSNDRLVTTPPPTARLLLTLYCNHFDPLLIAGRSRCGFHCGRCHPAFPKTLARNLAQGRISDVAGLRAPPTSHSRVAPCRLAPSDPSAGSPTMRFQEASTLSDCHRPAWRGLLQTQPVAARTCPQGQTGRRHQLWPLLWHRFLVVEGTVLHHRSDSLSTTRSSGRGCQTTAPSDPKMRFFPEIRTVRPSLLVRRGVPVSQTRSLSLPNTGAVAWQEDRCARRSHRNANFLLRSPPWPLRLPHGKSKTSGGLADHRGQPP